MGYVLRVLLICLTCTTALNTWADKLDVGEQPYNALGKTLDKQEILASDYKGKVVIISFWATWCGPCMKELPVLSGIQKSAGTEQLQVIAINYKEPRKHYKRVVKALEGTDMILLSDPKGLIGKKFGVDGIPHMVILDRTGTIAAVHVGYGEGALPGLVDEINRIAAQ